ncbi:MAG: OadG family protein [Firmicutes bacterium]|nr:OadG family protein [Bacillota bacterium]
MFEYFVNGTNLQKSLFLMIIGMAGVFAVLILIFVLIKLLIKMFPEKG